MPSTICPKCKHSSSQHYAGCMVEMVEVFEGHSESGYCECEERFNLETGVRLPNRAELIELLERAADTLQSYAANDSDMNDSLAMEITRKLKGEA